MGVLLKKLPSMAVGISHVIVLMDLQQLKHAYPRLVTEEGISMEVRDEQPSKQRFPNLVTEEGITVLAHPVIIVLLCVCIIALQFSLES